MLQVAFRLDATAEIGIGHLMRCLALADILRRRKASIRFICCSDSKENFGFILERGFTVEIVENEISTLENSSDQKLDAKFTFEALGGEGLDWVVVDHYGLDATWETEFSNLSPKTKLMVIDDLADRYHVCEMLIDAGMQRSKADYNGLVPDEACVHTGVRYVLLRQEFKEKRLPVESIGRKENSVPRILISFGGGAAAPVLDVTLTALEHLSQAFDFEATVIGSTTKSQLNLMSQIDITHKRHSNEMAKEITESDIIIGAAGGTAWERCCIGRPSVFVQIADNQSANFRALSKARAGLGVRIDEEEIQNAVEALLNDKKLRDELARNAWHLCDGLGAERVASLLISGSIALRPAIKEDARFIFDARYKDEGARFYRNQAIPEFEEHLDWFKSALARNDLHLFVVELAGAGAAHIRFDVNQIDKHRLEIGIALAPSHRGIGLGYEILREAVKYARSKGFHLMDAEVHWDNYASQKIFEKVGFIKNETKNGAFLSYALNLD